MRNDLARRLGVAGLAVLLGVGVLATGGSVVRLMVWAPVLFLVPGYALTRALRLGFVSPLERAVLSVGGSLAIIIAGGLLLDAVDWLSWEGWVTWLGGVTVALALTIGRAPGARAYGAGWRLGAGLQARHLLAFGLAGGVTLSAFVLAAHDAADDQQFRYSEFWMVPSGPGLVGALILGVRNEEGEPHSFEVDLFLDKSLVSVAKIPGLEPGEAYLQNVPIPPVDGNRHKIEGRLFKDRNTRDVYRKVSFSFGPRGGSADEGG